MKHRLWEWFRLWLKIHHVTFTCLISGNLLKKVFKLCRRLAYTVWNYYRSGSRISMGTPGMRFSVTSRDIIADCIVAGSMITLARDGFVGIFVCYGGTHWRHDFWLLIWYSRHFCYVCLLSGKYCMVKCRWLRCLNWFLSLEVSVNVTMVIPYLYEL